MVLGIVIVVSKVISESVGKQIKNFVVGGIVVDVETFVVRIMIWEFLIELHGGNTIEIGYSLYFKSLSFLPVFGCHPSS